MPGKHISVPTTITVVFVLSLVVLYNTDTFVFWAFLVTFALPITLALWSTVLIYRKSGFRVQVAERILKRERLRKAGVAIVISRSDKILMNLQEQQEPWRDLFIPPAGYFREEDQSTGQTARRRFDEITNEHHTNDTVILNQGFQVAKLDTSSERYIEYTSKRDYSPVDVDAYYFEKRDGGKVEEEDIETHKDLQWIDVDELRNRDDIQSYYKELSLALIAKDESRLKFWNLTEDGRRLFESE